MTAFPDDAIVLKWGTLKGWKLDKPESRALLQRYADLGMAGGALQQRDTAEQKALLCELLRQHDGTILNDWSGELYSRDQAIAYLETYGKGSS